VGTFRTFIERPRQLALRRWIFQIHMYVGLLLGLYFVVVCLTGAALVFRPEIERSLVAKRAPVAGREARPFQAGWENLRRAYPQSTFGGFSRSSYPPTAPDDPYRVKVQSGRRGTFVYVDHWTGEIVGVQHPVITWVQDLHFNLLNAAAGLLLNGIGAGLLALMCLSGAVVWWPGRAKWKRGFTITRRGRWQTVNYDLHSVIGATAMVLLLAIAVSGTYLALRNFSRFPDTRVGWQASVASWPVDLDAVVDRADAAVPGGVLVGLSLPQTPSDTFRVEKTFDQHSSIIRVDQRTGRVTSVRSRDDVTAVAGIDTWLGDTHYGRLLGPVTRIIWVLVGLAPVLLFVTGCLMWWNRVVPRSVREFNWSYSDRLPTMPGRNGGSAGL